MVASAPREPAVVSGEGLADAYLSGLPAKSSRRTMASAIRQIAIIASDGQLDEDSFPWWALRASHVAIVRASMAERLSDTTTNRYLAGLRGMLDVCRRRGSLAAEDYRHAVAAARSVPRRRGAVAPMDHAALFGLLAACDDGSATGCRDAALVTLVICGAAKKEIVELRLEDWDAQQMALQFRGDGRRRRKVILDDPRLAQRVTAWLRVRGSEPGALLTPAPRARGRVRVRHLRPTTIDNVVLARARRAGLGRITAEELRQRALATIGALHGAKTVRAVAGHERSRTSERYTPSRRGA